jgi:hypothetical protein
MSASQSLSGVVFNQNQAPTQTLVLSNTRYYQEFFLPSSYKRGADATEQYIPALSGWQLLVNIATPYAFTATMDWSLEYQVFGIGWIKLAEGVTIGAHADGSQVWFDMYFDEPVEISDEIANSRMRFGFTNPNASLDPHKVRQPVVYDGNRAVFEGNVVEKTLTPNVPYPFTLNGEERFLYYDAADKTTTWSAQQGVTQVWIAAPNPLTNLGFSRLYQPDGVTPVQFSGEDCSVDFRVLGLVADDGVDYLGNIYRSAVIPSDAHNVSTVDGDVDKAWLSKPNPSRFAVESQYFDVRQIGSTTYGLRNMVVNPSFERGYNNWYPDSFVSTVTTNGVTSGTKAAAWIGTPSLAGAFPGFYSDHMPCRGNRQYSAKFDFKAVSPQEKAVTLYSRGTMPWATTSTRTLMWCLVVSEHTVVKSQACRLLMLPKSCFRCGSLIRAPMPPRCIWIPSA